MRILTAPLAIALVASGLAGGAAAHVDGPPPGSTGGFGEDTCLGCHFDGPLNDPGGSLRLDGIPSRYVPGRSYRIEVVLSRPETRRGGFQMTARFGSGAGEGRQAGRLEPVDTRAAVVQTDSPIQYAQHTGEGSLAASPGMLRWSVLWTAPEAARGEVVFHAAANAASNDDSELGDWIYAEAAESFPR
jgi:hypothetical protein